MRDINPNQKLLSKKAVRARERKLQLLNTNELDHQIELNSKSIARNSLGGRQWKIVKSNKATSKFDERTFSSKKIPMKLSDEPVRILGSRQKKLTASSGEIRQDEYRLAEQQNNRHTTDKDRTWALQPDPSLRLGGRQLQLLGSRKHHLRAPYAKSNNYSNVKNTKNRNRKRGRIRKVLKGRRKVSSSEFRHRTG